MYHFSNFPMKHFLSALLLAGFTISAGCSAPATAAPVVIENDTLMGEMQAHGNGTIRVGDYYYNVSVEHVPTGFAINVYRSSDLKNWTFRNQILTSQSDPALSPGGADRPKLLYNDTT